MQSFFHKDTCQNVEHRDGEEGNVEEKCVASKVAHRVQEIQSLHPIDSAGGGGKERDHGACDGWKLEQQQLRFQGVRVLDHVARHQLHEENGEHDLHNEKHEAAPEERHGAADDGGDHEPQLANEGDDPQAPQDPRDLNEAEGPQEAHIGLGHRLQEGVHRAEDGQNGQQRIENVPLPLWAPEVVEPMHPQLQQELQHIGDAEDQFCDAEPVQRVHAPSGDQQIRLVDGESRVGQDHQEDKHIEPSAVHQPW
mmetsp:Transcript_119272/g.283111  ORF Transcript_119272/g.283111 Transcript_119272/m.283111 type:complete len:252 (-) Transcript_119272:694-1449(-)